MRLEEQLERLGELGLTLEADASIEDLLRELDRAAFEDAPFERLLFALGEEVDRAPHGRTLCPRVWNFDGECMYGAGSYVSIVHHLVRLADASTRVTDVRDQVGSRQAFIEYTLDGVRRHWDAAVQDDWADISVVRRIMADLESGAHRFYVRDNGQAEVVLHLDESAAARLNLLANDALVPAVMSHAQFWRTIAEREQTVGLFVLYRALDPRLCRESKEQFLWWLSAYDVALTRIDLRAACRVAVGSNDAETFDGFRAFLIAQGEDVVKIATRDLDALPAPTNRHSLSDGAFLRNIRRDRGLGIGRDIPGRDAWTPDWNRATLPATPEAFRSRYPRLTKNASDADLQAASNVAVREAGALPPPSTHAPKRVKHPKFGEGVVVATEGEKLVIEFAIGRKTISRSFVELID